MRRRSFNLDGTSLVVAGALFGVLLLLLWRNGYFKFNETAVSAQVFVGSLALVGTVSTAILSLVGISIKSSYDRRTEARLTEAEKRLKLEAAVEVIKLFSPQADKTYSAIQRTGALFMLASLGQHELTLTLLTEVLGREDIDKLVAADLIDHALIQNESPHVQQKAVNLLVDNASYFITGSSFVFPRILLDGAPGLSSYVRDLSVDALIKLLFPRSHAEWVKNGDIYTVVAAIALVWLDEPDRRVKNDVAALLLQLLEGVPEIGAIPHPLREVNVPKIRRALNRQKNTLEKKMRPSTRDLIKQLRQWSERDTV